MAGSGFKMANLRRPAESLKPESVGKIKPDPYSYEHRITLDQDTLDKLGMDMPKTGDKFHVLGHAEVRSVSSHDDGPGKKTSRVELQLKRLGVKPASGSVNSLFGAVNKGISDANDDNG